MSPGTASYAPVSLVERDCVQFYHVSHTILCDLPLMLRRGLMVAVLLARFSPSWSPFATLPSSCDRGTLRLTKSAGHYNCRGNDQIAGIIPGDMTSLESFPGRVTWEIDAKLLPRNPRLIRGIYRTRRLPTYLACPPIPGQLSSNGWPWTVYSRFVTFNVTNCAHIFREKRCGI